MSMTGSTVDLAFFSARFSLRDFPDFLDIELRGDLSDNRGPLLGEPEWSRYHRPYATEADPGGTVEISYQEPHS